MRQRKIMAAVYADRRGDLLRYASAITGDAVRAEDIVQDAWLRYDRVAATQPVTEPVGLLFRIVRNLALDRRRRQAHERRIIADAAEIGDLHGVSDDRPSPEQQALASDEMKRLAAALAELDDRTRIAVEMHRLQDARLQDIAERLDISVTAAHTLVTNGLRHCRRRLQRPS